MRVGTSLVKKSYVLPYGDHPHACGDKACEIKKLVKDVGSSPCVWGQDCHFLFSSNCNRIIPMRVGTSRQEPFRVGNAKDHPHACGDKSASTAINFSS